MFGSCLSQRGKGRSVHDQNRELIFGEKASAVFKNNEKTKDDGASESACLFLCNGATGLLNFVGDGSTDHKMIPNCMVKKTRSTSVTGPRHPLYFIYCYEATGNGVTELVLTEYEVNKNYVTSWAEFVRVKLKNIAENNRGGFISKVMWAFAYKSTFDTQLESIWTLIWQ